MAKYLFEASYTTEGIKGVAEKGGTARKAAVQSLAKSLGGKVESFHFAFGGTDAYVILDLPDNETAAAAALAVSTSGAVNLRTVVLITPEEMDAATQRDVKYRAPGT